MRKFFLSAVLMANVIYSFGQQPWIPGSGVIYSYPSTAKIGIGTSSPSQMLDVVGNIKASGTVTGSNINANGSIFYGSSSLVWSSVNNGAVCDLSLSGQGGVKKFATFDYTSGIKLDSRGQSFIFNSNDAIQMYINNGKVGIGTASPQSKLELYEIGPFPSGLLGTEPYRAMRFYLNKMGHENGNFMDWPTIEIESYVSGLQIINKANGFPVMLRIGEIQGWSGTSTNGYVNCSYELGASGLRLNDQSGNGHSIQLNTNGTSYFGGKIYATEVEVKANVWADFVFKKDYKLLSIAELENYIKENNKLPDVPSESEAKEKLNLGDMNALLLKKIEELSLYIIQQQKEINRLNEKIDSHK